MNTVPTEPPTTCPDLTLPGNGMISYNMGTFSPRPVDTVATYTCTTGYTLNGGSTRTCGSDGVWSGFAPDCQRKWNGLYTVCLLSVSSPMQLTALTYPHWPMGWLCTVLDPLTTYLSSLVLHTPATLATLSLEVPSGLVWVEGSGLDQLQLVNVSGIEFVLYNLCSLFQELVLIYHH